MAAGVRDSAAAVGFGGPDRDGWRDWIEGAGSVTFQGRAGIYFAAGAAAS